MSAAVTSRARSERLGRARRWLSSSTAGIDAVMVKELRGRMRGKRAFVILTVYLLLLALFGWMVEQILERNFISQFGGFNFVSGQLGQQLFVALLMLETLLVPFLAPALTASAVSLEREKQTLDLLTATPISSVAIVVGKLLSALTYVFLLIVASIPLTALVFVFGGVAPEDILKGYIVLLVTAIGFGSVGVFFSSLVQRTQPATVLTYAVVFAMTMGALFVWVFWGMIGTPTQVEARPAEEGGAVFAPARPPEALLYFNPFIAQVDVICGTEPGYGSYCSIVGSVTNQPFFGTGVVERPQPAPAPGVALNAPGVALNDVAIAPEPQPFGVLRDTYWPKSVAAWLILSTVLIGLSVQLVSPTRGWRWRLPFFRGRGSRDSG